MQGSRSRSRSRSRSPTHRRRLQSKRVVLLNLPYHTSAGQLRCLFRERLGYVGLVNLLEEHGRPAGIGYVDFKTFEGADEAIQKMTGVEIEGRKLLVREERPQDRERFERARMSVNNFGNDPALLQQLGINGPVTNSVFVGNLDYRVTWQKLKDVFRLAGRVLKADVIDDREGKSKGVGVVKFETAFEALQAISMFNNQTLFDRPMNVRLDFGPGRGPADAAAGVQRGPVLPEGLGGIGMGLGAGGAPARSVEEIGSGFAGGGYGEQIGGAAPPMHAGYDAYPSNGHYSQQRAPTFGRSQEFAVQVGNLPTTYTWMDLKRAFREAGDVRYADVQANGRGIVKFSSIADAERAVSLLHGARLDGNLIHVSFE